MQDAIILIPPTHEQSVFTYHVEESLLTRFVEFLAQKGLTPWRNPTPLDKDGPDGESLFQVEVDTVATGVMMEDLRKEFLEGE